MTFQLIDNCKYGRFLIPTDDIYVGNALKEYGEYSEIELELLLQFILPNTRVIAVGANIGAMVVPLAKKAAEVVTFEPQRWVYQMLCANLSLNNLVNVRAYWAAVGSRRGKLTVPILDPFKQNNFGAFELESMQQYTGDSVPVYTLDSLPDMDCGLITVDVEGMEEDVLRGGEQLIKKCRPIVFFEADRALKRAAVFNLLRNWDYQLHWYRTPLYNPENFRKVETDIWRGEKGEVVVAENVLATPRERNITLTGFAPVLEG